MTLREEIELLCINAGDASRKLSLADTDTKNRILLRIAELLETNTESLLAANKTDLEAAEENGVPQTMRDRLALSETRILGICQSLKALTELEDPIGKRESWTRPSGLTISRVRVPLGVVAMIYEARPNVTVDSAALCLKTGNAVVLRGGKEAINTNKEFVRLIKLALSECGFDEGAVGLITSTSRESANALMSMRGLVDVLIPRGGKGLIAMHTKEEDFIEKVLVANSHDYLLMFTDSGKIFVRKVYRIPEASRTAKGSNIINLIEIEKGERVTAMVTLSEFIHGEYLTMVTEKGVIKRTDIAEYEYQRKGGKIAINLDEGDRLIFVGHTDGSRHILIATKNGYGARFDENKVNVVGRTARGVRGIDLRAGDIVCGAVIVDNDKQLLTITENGYGKKSFFDEFEPRNRGIMGVIAHNISEKTGKLAAVACVDDNKDVMVITNEGVIIRTATDVIPTYKRSTTGVKIMRLDDGAIVANTTLVDKEDDEENEAVFDGIENAQEVNEAAPASEQVTENNEKTDTPPAENE